MNLDPPIAINIAPLVSLIGLIQIRGMNGRVLDPDPAHLMNPFLEEKFGYQGQDWVSRFVEHII